MQINGWELRGAPSLPLIYAPHEQKAAVYPERHRVFHALELVRPEEVRVVLLGQDPYHSVDSAGVPKAWGLAFGYNPEWRGEVNSSLRNIRNELEACNWDLTDSSLLSWAKQGVLLLNTQLTVPASRPLGHVGLWDECVDSLLGQVPRTAVGLAWGAPAGRLLSAHLQSVVATSHPCRHSAARGRVPFLGSACFEEVNRRLMDAGDRPIIWGRAIQ